MFIASILFSLQRWIDAQQRNRQAEIRAFREHDEEDGEGDGDDDEPADVYTVAVPDSPKVESRYECKVCQFGSLERTYCPRCLADTLVPVR